MCCVVLPPIIISCHRPASPRTPPVAAAAAAGDPVATETNLRSPAFQLAAFRQREQRLLQSVAVRLQKLSRDPELGQFGAWSRCMNHLLKLAKAHIETVVLVCGTSRSNPPAPAFLPSLDSGVNGFGAGSDGGRVRRLAW